MTYRFVQGIDYGARQGSLGLSWHMAEGGDGTLGYLSRHAGETMTEWRTRVRGVSCNALLLETGEVVQMLGWDRASGNLNPADRADEYGYYGGHHLRDVLGSHWPDPNTWTVSMEICGYRAAGPNDKQRDAAIRLGKEMAALFPSIRGAVGHHDQSPKGCPGLSANMKAIFAGVGGHGLWPTLHDTAVGDDMLSFRFIEPAVGTVTVKGTGHALIRLSDGIRYAVTAGEVRESFAKITLLSPLDTAPGDRSTCYLIGKRPADATNIEAAILLATDVTYAAAPVATADCTNAVAAEHERVRTAAIAAASAL